MAASARKYCDHMVRVLVVDDHEVVRRGVADLLEEEDDLTVVGEAGVGGRGNLPIRVPAARPDIAVLDIRLPDGNGVELCRDLRSCDPDLQVPDPHLVLRRPGDARRHPGRCLGVSDEGIEGLALVGGSHRRGRGSRCSIRR